VTFQATVGIVLQWLPNGSLQDLLALIWRWDGTDTLTVGKAIQCQGRRPFRDGGADVEVSRGSISSEALGKLLQAPCNRELLERELGLDWVISTPFQLIISIK
jgi:hypothetical protein